MMNYEVAKAFNTVNRRLSVGSTVTESDDLSPFSLEERLEKKFLKAPADQRVAEQVKPSRKPVAEPAADEDPK